jgi:hypothetical protein
MKFFEGVVRGGTHFFIFWGRFWKGTLFCFFEGGWASPGDPARFHRWLTSRTVFFQIAEISLMAKL